MAKSMRSKVKRSFRSKKRETGVYAAVEAARLNRLNSKLVAVANMEAEAAPADDELPEDAIVDDAAAPAESMELDGTEHPEPSEKISTHGPRGSRRESWRASKGMIARPQAVKMNRQGTVAARRKSGRPSRRR